MHLQTGEQKKHVQFLISLLRSVYASL